MNIGLASQKSGVSAKMIRYYEQSGLIPKAERKDSGYRDYSLTDVHRLQFIRHARELGFSMAEIGDLLKLWQDKSRQSSEVRKIAQNHIQRLGERIETLQKMVMTLKTLTSSCAGDSRPDCPILAELENPDETRPSQASTSRGHLRHHI